MSERLSNNDTLSELNTEEIAEETEVTKDEVIKDEIEEEEKEEEEEEDEDKIELKEEDEDEEEELDLKSEDEEDLILPPRIADINKKFPTLFKEFPYLKKALFREKEYNELFGSFDDAKELVEQSQVFKGIEAELNEGKADGLFTAVRNQNPEAFHKIVDNYLPTLAKVDKEAYFTVLGNVFKHAIVNMVGESKRTENEDLKQAAAILNQFIFGTSEYTPPTQLSKPDSGKDEVKKEREQFISERLEDSKKEIDNRVTKILRSTVDLNIDQKNSMSPYIKKNAVREAVEHVTDLIKKDASFNRSIERLWERAKEEKFSNNSVDAIRKAYLSKAKTLLPASIKKVRNEVLKDLKPSVKSEERRIAPGRSTPERSKSSKQPEFKRGMSTLDFLSSD